MHHPVKPVLRKLKTGFGPREYITLLLRRRWIILIALVSVILTTAFYIMRMVDIYESFATVVIEEENTLIRQAMNRGGRSMSFYRGILNSRGFLDMVFDSIGIEPFQKVAPKYSRNDALLYIQSNLSLKPTNYSSLTQVNARALSKELAYKIAKFGTHFFRLRCQEVETEESRTALKTIENQIAIIIQKLERAERDYQKFLETTGPIANGVTPELQNLQNRYAKDRAQLGVKETDLAAAKKQLARLEAQITPPEKTQSAEFLKLRSRLRELEKEKVRLENLGIRIAGTSQIDREIAEVERELLRYRQPTTTRRLDPRLMQNWQQLRKTVINQESSLEYFKQQLRTYKRAIEKYKAANPDLLNKSLELMRLKRAKDLYESIYNVLIGKLEEERIRSASSGIGIKIVDEPRMPSKPIPKKKTQYYVFAVLFGLFLGIGLAFLLEYNDTSIKSNEDIERHLGLSILGTIPHMVYQKKENIAIRRKSGSSKKRMSIKHYPRHLLNFKGDDSIITESYRSLRTNISFASPDKPIRTLIITSAGPSEGKSLTTANCAIAYAQMGKRILLVDTDLRRPVLHHLFDVPREPGFSELFMENPEYESTIRPTPHENLFLLSAGRFSPNPAELLGSQRMSHHIDYFINHYDMIFFDTPPIVAVTDASLLSTKVDGVLLVIKSHKTDRELIQRAITNITNVGAHIIGTVLNDINLSHRYSSYGYYKYYYHYYKSKLD